jgi:hypothetical protein
MPLRAASISFFVAFAVSVVRAGNDVGQVTSPVVSHERKKTNKQEKYITQGQILI